MNDALFFVNRFAAAAIEEALNRRQAPVEYSAREEVGRLVAGLSSPSVHGLDPRGKATNARAALESLLAKYPDQPLARVFRTLPAEGPARNVFLLLLAWALEPRIGVLFGHVHDALQRTRPTAGACAEILADSAAVAAALVPSGALLRTKLLELDRFGPDGVLGIDARLVAFIATGTLPPLVLPSGSIRLVAPSPAGAGAGELGPDILVVRGPEGSGRRRAILAQCAQERRAALFVELGQTESASELVLTALRDARWLDARLCVSGVLDPASAAALAEATEVPLAFRLGPEESLPAAILTRPAAVHTLGVPPASERARLWAELLQRDALAPDIVAVADRYAFTAGVIRRAAIQAVSVGAERAARMQLEGVLEGLSFPPKDGPEAWTRLVLPEAALEQLRGLCAQARHATRVEVDWGFARRHSLGHGVKALFHGRPGTGKTLAAELLAAELELPLCRIDLSRVVSKWIGETERNLASLFERAQQSRAILFFDEADSLFARRTAIQSSTDRYANMEVNYLLQRIELHDGIVILATNLKGNIDEAFSRRLHYVVEFPEPDARARERIWRLSVPAEAPLSEDVDFALFARRFEIPGGAIKSAVLGAAYVAAAEGTAIHQRHIAVALRREYAKLDQLYQKAELDALAMSLS
ncbi:MAG TPA: ATP-binding protein [Polyangiaceae bacterium]|nr:ATP-binding protein [Polyangiaceae bacterium]